MSVVLPTRADVRNTAVSDSAVVDAAVGDAALSHAAVVLADSDLAPEPAQPAMSSKRPRLSRDVFIDAVRAIGTISIVTVHWLMPEATWDGVTLTVGNALGHGSAWIVTWLLQALPLMFFAAGAAAAYGNARRPPRTPVGRDVENSTSMWRDWDATLVARLRAIVRPVAVFVATWMATIVVLLALGVPGGAVWPLAAMAPQLLWFLGVWMVLLGTVSGLVRAWRRWRWRALVVAVALPMAIDFLRFTAGAESLAWANLLLVWTVPFLAGIAYADDRVTGVNNGAATRRTRRTWWQLLVLSIGAMVTLIVVGPYPWSMIGMPGDAISNLGPPTAPVVVHAVAQVCVVLLARTAIVRWATGRGRPVVAWLARRSMTVYLWHLTAMFTAVGLVLVVANEPLPTPWSVEWWASRPVWFVAFSLILSVLVLVFGRFEGPRTSHRKPSTQLPSTQLPTINAPTTNVPTTQLSPLL